MGHLLWVNGKKKKKKASAIVYFINPFVGLRLASPTENLDSRGYLLPEVYLVDCGYRYWQRCIVWLSLFVFIICQG